MELDLTKKEFEMLVFLAMEGLNNIKNAPDYDEAEKIVNKSVAMTL